MSSSVSTRSPTRIDGLAAEGVPLSKARLSVDLSVDLGLEVGMRLKGYD